MAQIRRLQGRIKDAEVLYEKATRASNVDPRAYLNYGCFLLERHEIPKAIKCFSKALSLHPKYASAYVHRGWAKIQLNDYDGAAKDIKHAMMLAPESSLPFLAMGDLLSRTNDLNAAIENYKNALAIDLNLADAHSGLGSCLLVKGEYESALKSIEAALILNPSSCNALANRGRFHALTGNFTCAINDYLRALAIDDKSPTVWTNLGNAYVSKHQNELADKAFERALNLSSNNSDALLSRAFLYLSQEKYEEGWRLYAARPISYSSKHKPLWQGETLTDKTLLIVAEHGIGDELFYGTLLKKIEKYFRSIIVQVDDRLQELFQRSFLNYTVIGKSEKISEDQFDYYLPAGSLPQLFVNSVQDLPYSEGYLKVAAGRYEAISKKLENFPKPWIGISWISKNPFNGIIRSITLEKIKKIFTNQKCTIISLQYGEDEESIFERNIDNIILSSSSLGVDPFSDIDGLAAIVATCDAVVSVDNSTVHLAGALGVQTYVLLSNPADWRWTQDKAESGWYQSVQLVRQKHTFLWESVLEEVRIRLFPKSKLSEVNYLVQDQDANILTTSLIRSCAVICPVGPGHEQAFAVCQASVESAVAHSKGPFCRIEFIPIFDLDGKLGRSKARNIGIDKAVEGGFEWIYFIDADDFMTPYAFEDFAKLETDSDAVWGMICEAPAGRLNEMKLREKQMLPTTSFADFLSHDPYLSIQMGHFVKTEIAKKCRFDEVMNAGEDFKYYLQLWRNHNVAKTSHVYFVNCRGNHSTGPRSASANQWRIAVEELLSRARQEFLNKLSIDNSKISPSQRRKPLNKQC